MASIATRCVCCAGAVLEKSPAVLMPFVAKRVFDWETVEITAGWGLRDLRQGSAYAVCNTCHCIECGLLFLDLRFDNIELERLYNGYRGEAYTSLRDAYEPGYARRNELLLRGGGYVEKVEAFISSLLPEPRSVLDWGGDSGINTPFAARLRDHHVFDISATPLVQGAQRVDGDSLQGQYYDLIVLSQVLEHIPYPLELLRKVVSVLQAGSLLYVEVPYERVMRNIVSGQHSWREKRHWHEHVNFFSENSLRRLLGAVGVEVSKLEVMEVDVGSGPVEVFSIACHKCSV